MKVKRFFVAILLALSVVFGTVFMAGCGGTKLEEGKYSGTYKCTYTENGAEVHAGYTVTFEVDGDNVLWNIETSAPAADWSGAAEGEKYATPALGQRPWDGGKILGQFSGIWTVDEFMSIEVAVDANGKPTGSGCITCDKEVTVGVGFETGTGIVILAIQEGIRTANKI